MDQTAENYQLKWHSFSSYLHSCVATSFLNESFADVVLVTTEGRQMLAHRFVLSACSQYLHQILKLQPKLTTSLPLVIVLPPEITYKTLKILIQYMYSGEATVSKDVLEFVLRGGDILKIKGLWRPKDDDKQPKHEERLVKVSSSGQQSVRDRTKSHHHNQKSSSSSDTNNTANNNHNNLLNSSSSNNNDKEDNNEDSEAADEENLVVPALADPKPKTYSTASKTNCTGIKQRPINNSSSVIRRTDDEKKPVHQLRTPGGTDNMNAMMTMSASTDDTLEFLVIKEEPIEWSEVNESDMELVDEKEIFNTEMTIKPEIYMEEDGGEEDVDVEEASELYSPLTCELCTETFALPADWVRHIQTHTDMLPAKRQRRGKGDQDDLHDAPFPPLHCDLCQKYFPTPAEWVHHIQNTHTEFELHLSNKTPGKVFRPSRSHVGPSQNTCLICNKKFPSHASLLIHKRTHTGEKPYMCEMCYKGFNVKSNLLRHLRTVHDKIINPTEVDRDEVQGNGGGSGD